ncbi:hypothetical protein HY990_00700 [Candidatus Micrarchaeota archaeon]|nr:hypothetical protein [Candidatus Micrarchaeota archaeon]
MKSKKVPAKNIKSNKNQSKSKKEGVKKETKKIKNKIDSKSQKELKTKMAPKIAADEPKKEEMKKITTILADSQIRQRLIELGGENAIAIVRNFYGNYSDDDIAKKLQLKISDVRATLNKLHNEGLVNYLREKDNETGWYSYSWSINVMRVERWAGEHLKNTMNYQTDQEYYFCPACGTPSILNFESAMTAQFKCERCDKNLEFIDEKRMTEIYGKKEE